MESFLKTYKGQFNVLVATTNEAYGAMDAMDAAGVTYGVTAMSSSSPSTQLMRPAVTLDGKFNCNVECNPIQAQTF